MAQKIKRPKVSKTLLIAGAKGRIGSALVKYIDALEKGCILRLTYLEISDKRGMKIVL